MELSWDHVYLLGWISREGSPRLTTWNGGDRPPPWIDVVVTSERGGSDFQVPMWSGPVGDCKLHAIPEGKDFQEYAREIGGLHAFGWLMREKIERRTKMAAQIPDGSTR